MLSLAVLLIEGGAMLVIYAHEQAHPGAAMVWWANFPYHIAANFGLPILAYFIAAIGKGRWALVTTGLLCLVAGFGACMEIHDEAFGDYLRGDGFTLSFIWQRVWMPDVSSAGFVALFDISIGAWAVFSDLPNACKRKEV